MATFSVESLHVIEHNYFALWLHSGWSDMIVLVSE